MGTVLTNSQGYTLYHLTTDTSTKSTCAGSCASTWPPFVVSGAMPTAGSGVTGKLGTLSRSDGSTQ